MFLLWLVFTWQLKPVEMLAGLAAAALAATATEAVRREAHPRFFPYIPWVLAAWRLPGQIATDGWLVTRKLARMISASDRQTGFFRSVPFRAGGNDTHSVARRALAILYATLPPNSIVIGIDRQRHSILFHLLEEDETPGMIRVLEGKA